MYSKICSRNLLLRRVLASKNRSLMPHDSSGLHALKFMRDREYATNGSHLLKRPEGINSNGRTAEQGVLSTGDKLTVGSESLPPIVRHESPGLQKKALEDKITEMHTLLERYTASFPRHHSNSSAKAIEGEVVLVTGTTGALGTNVLAQLLKASEVIRVYAVNRTQKGGTALRTKQASALKERGLDPGLVDSPKLVLVEADTSAQGLGVSRELFEEIRDSITLIMHNAWPVHFKRPLATFESVIRGLRHLVDLALSSPRGQPPRFMFTSSIGVFRNYVSSENIPEIAVDARDAVGSGYIESKWVGERILDIASQQTPLKPISVRVGQLSGGINGAWNIREWVPSIARSGQVVGCLPARQEVVAWLPVHTAAAALIEARTSSAQYLTLVHPRPIPWDSVFQPLSQLLGAELVPYSKWLKALEENTKGGGALEVAAPSNPALGLLDFFKAAEDGSGSENSAATLGLAQLSTTEATRASPALASEEPLTGKDVEQWIRYWRRASLLE